jgi:four helix bundle protein
MSGTYADLEVWQAAVKLAIQIYELTARFPKAEMFGLTSQLRRAAVSIPSNVAEGKGRSSDKELVQFLCHSRGSLFEIQTQLTIAAQLEYTNPEEIRLVRTESSRVAQMLNGLIRSVRPRPEPK